MLKNSFPLLLAVILLAAGLSSCEEIDNFRGWVFMPDMYDGPAVETYAPNTQIGDSISALKPVNGTVPRGFMAYQEFSPQQSGYDSAKANLTMPKAVPTDSVALVKGLEIYNIFCDHCHGDKGMGKGILVENGVYAGVPAYKDRDINLGSIFHVVTYGKNLMGAHASQITPEERWLVAQHVMKLRAQQTDEAPADEADAPEETEEAAADNQTAMK